MKETMTFRLILLLLLCCSQSSPLFAQNDNGESGKGQSLATDAQKQLNPLILNNYVEAGGNYEPLSAGFGYWQGGYIRTSVTQGRNVWNAELNGQREFGDSGVYFGGGDTFTLNPDWYVSASAGSSAGGFFWPRFRTDEFVNKKWLKSKQWITTLGFGYDAAKDVHRDHSFYAGTTYYFPKPWIVETGIRFNFSDPGNIFSPAGFVAVTQGQNSHHYITARLGAGVEAYQLVGPVTTLSDFESQTVTITWRQWVGRHWGINFIGDYYHNPYYQRGGPSLGLFKDF